MAALTADRATPRRSMQEALYDDYDVKGGVQLYAGSLVEITDDVAAPAGTSAAPDFYCVCEQNVNNTGGADGDERVTLRYRSSWLFKTDTGDQAGFSAGIPLYAVDDQTVSAGDGGGTRGLVGTCAHVPRGEFPAEVWVEVDGPLKYQAGL